MLISERSPHKSMILEKLGPSGIPAALIKKNKFLIELPKIYPIHKKLMTLKPKDIDFLRLNDRRFHLRGFKFLNEPDHTEDTVSEA